jgi:hypothetical protein
MKRSEIRIGMPVKMNQRYLLILGKNARRNEARRIYTVERFSNNGAVYLRHKNGTLLATGNGWLQRAGEIK